MSCSSSQAEIAKLRQQLTDANNAIVDLAVEGRVDKANTREAKDVVERLQQQLAEMERKGKMLQKQLVCSFPTTPSPMYMYRPILFTSQSRWDFTKMNKNDHARPETTKRINTNRTILSYTPHTSITLNTHLSFYRSNFLSIYVFICRVIARRNLPRVPMLWWWLNFNASMTATANWKLRINQRPQRWMICLYNLQLWPERR